MFNFIADEKIPIFIVDVDVRKLIADCIKSPFWNLLGFASTELYLARDMLSIPNESSLLCSKCISKVPGHDDLKEATSWYFVNDQIYQFLVQILQKMFVAP